MVLKKIIRSIIQVLFHSTDLKPVPPLFLPTLVILLTLTLLSLIAGLIFGLASAGYVARVCLLAGLIGIGLIIIKTLRFKNSV
jgi:hypothetical protein